MEEMEKGEDDLDWQAVQPRFVPIIRKATEWDWKRRYRSVAEFGEEPASQSVMGYVMADLLILSLEAAGREVTVEKLLTAFEGISHYDNPFGGPTMSFSPQKHVAGDSLNLYQVENQKWKTVAESLPY